jgi:hypothetical protein
MILGLVFGAGAATWAFSGMLSMDPFPNAGTGGSGTRTDGTTSGIRSALRGRPQLAAFAAAHPRDVLSHVADLHIKELELLSFEGEPVYLAHLGAGVTRLVTLDGRVREEFDRDRIAGIATRAAAPVRATGIRVLDQYDLYYLDRQRERPLPVILITLNDAQHTRYYIDPKTARVVGAYQSGDWVTRWLYHGLHSLDFPWLYNHRPAWDIVVITFMLGGTSLVVTSLVLAWQVLARILARSSAAGAKSPGGN